MKTTITLALLVSMGAAFAQPAMHKSVPFRSGQRVSMDFDYPNLVRVSTWDKNEVSVDAIVSINGGENNEAFKLEARSDGNTIYLGNDIDLKGIPHRITIVRDGQKMVFKDKAAWRKYKDEHGGGHDMMNDGVEMDIVLDIKVPHNAETSVRSVYGMVEVKNFTGPLAVKATYGGVDASLTERSVGELRAETNYGHIYSGLDMKINTANSREEDFHVMVSAKLGNGPNYSFESPYGNVYLRKNP